MPEQGMRRDYFTFRLQDVDTGADAQPTVRISYDGPSDTVVTRLTPETAVDIAFRFQTPIDDSDAEGVVSVTDRQTGAFILEVHADADEILQLIDAARVYGEATSDAEECYTVQIEYDTGEFETNKRTLLVYDNEGSLLRQHSLIPSGVEL